MLQKSVSELDDSVTRATQSRQELRSEIVTSTANNAAATELLKLAINRLHQFCLTKLLKAASKTKLGLEGRVYASMGGSITTTGPTKIGRTHVAKLRMVQAVPVSEPFNSKLEHNERFNDIGSLIGLVADLAMESQQAFASAAALDGEAASAFDAESSDLAAKIDALTKAIAALKKGAARSTFLQSGVGSTIRKVPLSSHRVPGADRSTLLFYPVE